MFGKQLRALRRQAGLRQADLAAIIGVSASALGMYEQGRRRPGQAVLRRLCAYFELPFAAWSKGENLLEPVGKQP